MKTTKKCQQQWPNIFRGYIDGENRELLTVLFINTIKYAGFSGVAPTYTMLLWTISIMIHTMRS